MILRWVTASVLLLGCSGRATGDGDGAGTEGSDAGTGDQDGNDAGSEAGDEVCAWEPASLGWPEIEVGPACEALRSEREAVPITIRIINDRDQQVRLTAPGSCVPSLVVVVDDAQHVFPRSECAMCDGSLVGDCSCLALCDQAAPIAIEPGGAFELVWPGVVAEIEEIGPECAGECAGRCDRMRSPVDGPLRVIIAETTLEQIVDCEEPCECEANADGWCELPGHGDGWSQIEQRVEWPPACDRIEVHLE